ncbi:MAG: MiaB/RimO family radical SAM methylthiotransferase, partial [Chitinophagales bacterium]
LVLGANEKFQIADYLRNLSSKKFSSENAAVYSCDINEVTLFESSYSFGERTRAFLKLQDGCDYSCTYCTIPLARGRSRSDTIAHAVEQSNLLAESGVKEIVLTGVNIGDFGLHNEKREETFFEMIQQLDEVNGIERFRISSIEPNLLSDEIIEFVAQSNRFMPHFHIPLQSGSDKILGLMKRRYRSQLYCDRVEKIKSLMPHCCIGADVIVGFPDETEREFLETYNFLNEIDLSYMHVFTYSERENTEAVNMNEVVPKETRHERNSMLRILSEKKKNAFYESQLGSARKVLFESKTEDGLREGFSDNYVRVKAEVNDAAGKILDIYFKEVINDFVYGENVNHGDLMMMRLHSAEEILS